MARKMSGEFSHFYTAVVKGLSEIEKKKKQWIFKKQFVQQGFIINLGG